MHGVMARAYVPVNRHLKFWSAAGPCIRAAFAYARASEMYSWR